MNKNYGKLMSRGIRKSLSRFLSILGIVALGSGFLAGLLATTPDMEKSASDYLSSHNAYDINIKSTLGLTGEDIKYLESLDDTDLVMPVYSTDLLLERGDGESFACRMMGISLNKASSNNFVNNMELVKGRMPVEENECLIEVPNVYSATHELGEKLSISKENDDYENADDTYRHKKYKVVGIVKSPLYTSSHGETTAVGDGRIGLGVYVNKKAYKLDEYTDVYMTLKKPKNQNAFSDQYDDFRIAENKRFEDLGEERAKLRTGDVKKEAEEKLDKKEKDYENAREKTERKLNKAWEKIQDSKTKIERGRAQLEELKKAETGSAAAQVRAQVVIQEEELDDADTEIKAAEADYRSEKAKAEKKLDRVQKKINDARKDVSDMEDARWYIFDRSDNVGLSGYKNDIGKINAIAKVFPVFFFLVAALVALTTMTRMIEEERLQIGTLKSLGYSNGRILEYYMIYSLIASVAGCAIGFSIGFTIFPKVISNAYGMIYNYPDTRTEFIWPIALAIGSVTVACILLTTWAACRGELREKAAQLLLPKAPKAGKRILLENIGHLWSRIKFTRKVTLRNLFRYKKRFIMTILGVAGCFALLVTGFGVRDSISDIVNKQYDELYKYDVLMETDTPGAELQDKALKDVLEDSSMVARHTSLCQENITVKKGKEKQKATLCVPKETDKLKEFITLRDRKTGDKVSFGKDSILLTEKMAEQLNVRKGDTVDIDRDDGGKAEFKVTGTTENYVSSYVYMGKDAYITGYGKDCRFDKILIKRAKGVSGEALSTGLLKSDETGYALASQTIRENFADSVKSIDYIVIVLIISAGLLAMIVLYNLTNVNVCERKKELATIKVLGFYEGEVSSYIFRETNLLSFIGIIVGVPLGIWLHNFTIKTAEVDGVMFGRHIYWQSFIYSALITVAFTLLVNLMMKKSIKDIDMVESMKAND